MRYVPRMVFTRPDDFRRLSNPSKIAWTSFTVDTNLKLQRQDNSLGTVGVSYTKLNVMPEPGCIQSNDPKCSIRADSLQVEELDAVFRERFLFHTIVVPLSLRRKPQHQLDRSMMQFIEEHDGAHNLLIVYYTGHGVYREDLGSLELAGTWGPGNGKGFYRDVRANWTKTEDLLRSDEVDADVLTILDTTYAGNIVTKGISTSSRGDRSTKRFELMAACSIGQTTAAPGMHSFTRALIDALTALSREYGPSPFTTFRLHQRISLDIRRRDTPSMLWSLLQDERHISLAPQQPGEVDAHLRHQLPKRSYLTLGLALRDPTLSLEQIQLLNKKLSTMLHHPMFGVRQVDWLSIEPMQASSSPAALAALAIGKWKRLVIKARKERA
jgi:hypothetical protein